MLRMSKLADYGTVVMAYLAQSPRRLHSAPEIAAATGLELPTVSKILKRLLQSRLLRSQRGARGGYLLAVEPDGVSVAEIIDAIEGHPMSLTECGSMPGRCIHEPNCAVRGSWQRVSRIMRAMLEQMSLAELAHPPTRLPVDAGAFRRPRREVQSAGMEGGS